MPSSTKRFRMEPESGESLAHENAESSSEEVREGSESEEASARPRTSRRRSARGAKQTKAPMDGESCGCGGGRAKKCTCDSGCSSYGKKMDRNDALTPQEYLAACDLGIQGRPRSYIRARLDAATVRLDKKCGASGIADNKECHVVSASAGSSVSKRPNTLAKIATIGLVGGSIALARHIEARRENAMKAREVMGKVQDLKYKANSGVTAAARGAAASVDFARTARYYKEKPGQRAIAEQRAISQGMAQVAEARQTRSAVYREARQALRELGEAVPKSAVRRRRARAERQSRSAPGGAAVKRDVYAAGFEFNPSYLGI